MQEVFTCKLPSYEGLGLSLRLKQKLSLQVIIFHKQHVNPNATRNVLWESVYYLIHTEIDKTAATMMDFFKLTILVILTCICWMIDSLGPQQKGFLPGH